MSCCLSRPPPPDKPHAHRSRSLPQFPSFSNASGHLLHGDLSRSRCGPDAALCIGVRCDVWVTPCVPGGAVREWGREMSRLGRHSRELDSGQGGGGVQSASLGAQM